MNNQLATIGALAMDLKRATFGSEKVFEVFINEVLKKRGEINKKSVPLYIQNVLNNLERRSDKEDLLMYSVLLQNYSQSGKQK